MSVGVAQVARLFFELLGQAARKVLDVVAVGFRAGQGDHASLGSLDCVHPHEQVVAARAYELELGLHVS
jgi:hypothetical protein